MNLKFLDLYSNNTSHPSKNHVEIEIEVRFKI